MRLRRQQFLVPAAVLLAAGLAFAATVVSPPSIGPMLWPTPNPAFMEGKDYHAWAQDTGTGDPHSGLFGCVRDDGHKFHEGIDIKPVQRNRAGEPLDAITAAFAGQVAYIEAEPSSGAYGRYIVLEHPHADVPVYTLYAHLASIEPGLRVGQGVAAGATIGKMGHSAVPPIRADLAHMHFEIGLRLSDNFQPWYDGKKFGSKNTHGLYNGYNLLAFDPVPFYTAVRDGKFKTFKDYIRGLPTAFKLRVTTAKVPDFILRYPALLTKPVPTGGVAGWDIDFTWYGLPKEWTPLPKGTAGLTKPGDIALVSYDKAEFKGCMCRDTLLFDTAKPTATPKLGTDLKDYLKIVFGFK